MDKSSEPTIASPEVPAPTKRAAPAEVGAGVVLALVFLFFAVQRPEFRSVGNLRLLLKQASELAVVSTGMTLVIATGGIDISVGSVLALCSMVLASLCVKAHWPVGLACVAAIVAGAACGLFNGLLIARAKLPPIIVTLATWAMARAAVTLFNNAGSISGLPPILHDTIDQTNIAGLPLLFWAGVLTLVGGGVLLRRTCFGRQLLAIGGNRLAAELSGTRVARVETLVYVLSGALAGAASILTTARASAAEPNAGLFLELIAITSVALGGTAISGGQATILGTGLGVLTINVLVSGGRLYGQEDQVARFLVGVALLVAVEVQRRRAAAPRH